jgi:hypothetical protein
MNVQINPTRQLELWAIRKTQWSAGEYLELAHRYADAAHRMRIAVENEDFAGLKKASEDFMTIVDQSAFLNAGLQSAIDGVTKQDREFQR